MYKGQGGVVFYYAWDVTNNVPKTGDVANHTLRFVFDGGTPTAPTNSPAEVDATNAPGLYKLTATNAEMVYTTVALHGKSSTSGVYIMPQLFEPIEHDHIADSVWDELLTGSSHNITNSAGRRLRTLGTGILIFTGTATAGSTNTITFPAGASAVNDLYVGATINLTGGAGAGQSRRIINYVGATRVATVDTNWVANPGNTTVFDVLAGSSSLNVVEGTIISATSTTAVLGTEASTSDDIYVDGVLSITSGTGAGQFRDITDYVGSTRTATVAAWSVTPDSTSGYAVVPAGNKVSEGGTFPTAAEIATQVYDGFRLQSGSTLANYPFVMTLSADGQPAAGKSPTVEVSIDGAAFGTTGISNIAEIGSGAYRCDLAATATTGNVLLFKFSAPDCNTWFEKIVTTP